MLLIVDLDPQYWGFLKVFIKVHVFKKHLDLKKKDIYQAYIDRVKMLSKETGNWWAERKFKWEISLTEKIIEESGWYTEKYTGKFNNKYQPKIRKDGEVMVRQKHKGDRFKKKLRKPRRGK